MFAGLVLLDVPPVFPSLLAGMAVLVAVAFAGTVALARVDGERDFSTLPLLRWLPARLRVPVAARIPEFLDGLASLRDVRMATRAVGISLVAWLAEVVVYWMMGQAFGLDLSAAAYLPIMIGANLIVSLRHRHHAGGRTGGSVFGVDSVVNELEGREGGTVFLHNERSSIFDVANFGGAR